MKDGFRKDNKLDFKYKAKLSKRNKLYNEIKNKILQNVQRVMNYNTSKNYKIIINDWNKERLIKNI